MEITGSIQEKRGYYYAVVNLYKDGQRKPKWVPTKIPVKGINKHDEKNNRYKADTFLKEKLEYYQKIEDGEITESDGRLFSDFLDEWLNYKKGTVELDTYEGYVVVVNAQIKPYFEEKGTLLSNMTTEVIQEFINEKQINGRCDNKGGLSRSTLKHFKNVFNQALEYAVNLKLIRMNPCTGVRLPKKENSKPMDCFTASEFFDFVKAIKGEPLFLMILVSGFYGLRRSEALGLKWNAFNFEEDKFTIEHTVVRVKTLEYKNSTKSKGSHRSFPIPAPIKEALLKEKRHQESMAKLCGTDYGNTEYVFKWPDGNLFSPDYVTRRFRALAKKHCNRDMHFHCLRHSAASILIAMGHNLSDVQQWLGHADIETTVNTYGHLDMGHKEETTQSLEKKLNLEALLAS